MNMRVVDRLCHALLSEGLVTEQLSIIWHAGEPLTVPIDFYDEAITSIRKQLSYTQVRFCIQTNGTLIDNNWCALFRRHDIQIGVSLDGPEEIHNLNRRYRSGKGSFKQTIDGINCLKVAGISFSLLCVLTSSSITKADLLCDFFEGIGATQVCFNIDELDGSNLMSSFGSKNDRKLFKDFFVRYFRRSVEINSTVRIRELENAVAFIFRKDVGRANLEIEPFRILTVGWDGRFSTFSPELHDVPFGEGKKISMGSIYDQLPFSKALCSELFQSIYADISAGVESCRRECSYFEVCGGGAPANKYGEHGSFTATSTSACAFSTRSLADALVTLLNDEASYKP